MSAAKEGYKHPAQTASENVRSKRGDFIQRHPFEKEFELFPRIRDLATTLRRAGSFFGRRLAFFPLVAAGKNLQWRRYRGPIPELFIGKRRPQLNSTLRISS
jgi:hypothetical protein